MYAFNAPGAPVVLHDGPVARSEGPKTPGIVELRFTPKPGLAWRLPQTDQTFDPFPDDTILHIARPYGTAELPAQHRNHEEGWSNGASLGDPHASLQRLIAHWVNLPALRGQHHLITRTEGAEHTAHRGRWSHETGGWKITLDVRPDHRGIWKDLHQTHLYAITHVMELSRTDGSVFTADQAQPILQALHMGFSFALGRWVAPMLPVGLGTQDHILWEEWAARLCDPAKAIFSGWWTHWDSEALRTLVTRLVSACSDPAYAARVNRQLTYAVSVTRDEGFVEQRIMVGAAGLEHTLWQRFVLSGDMTPAQYNSLPAHKLLRRALQSASIPLTIDPEHLPALAELAAARKRDHGATMDGADLVTWVRNKLVHPTGAEDDVYRFKGAVTETWLLTRHYLTLLILESLGYQGAYTSLAAGHRYVGESAKVPWATSNATDAS
ncbi:hypothetical protein LEL86_18275 [Streptomyces sp. WA6-1-16]|nr:hypothetical protein [Streptomyces sp. WA6-1-16]UCA51103.1 hypothetical protein LEL86_18220 [Streptomyces sp. WA6-1-16]UCA51110.1 hypothetical protein LEL86_18275 [Streptomyces sp. WA6-1-16]